jgi:ribokinase
MNSERRSRVFAMRGPLDSPAVAHNLPPILVVGSINRDYFCHVTAIPRVGETVLGGDLTAGRGGKGANQALACSRMGSRTSLVACIGDDADGQAMLADLRADGVDVDGTTTLDDVRTGIAFVMVAEDGENSIVVAPGANARMTPELARSAVAERLRPDGILVLQAEIPAESIEAAIREAKLIGARVVLNLAPYIELSAEALLICDPLVVNEGEAATLLGLPPDAPLDAEEMASRLRPLVRSAVITLAAAGAVVVSADELEHVPAEVVPVVDSTGAGDAFTGALVATICQGSDLFAAVRRGVRAGSYAVSRAGAQSAYPTPADLREE